MAVGQVFLQLLRFSLPVSSYQCFILIYLFFLPGRQTDEAWVPSKKQCCFDNRGALVRKALSLLVFKWLTDGFWRQVAVRVPIVTKANCLVVRCLKVAAPTVHHHMGLHLNSPVAQHLFQHNPHHILLSSGYSLTLDNSGSYTEPETGYQTVLCDFPLTFHDNAGQISEIKPRQLPSLSFPVHFSRITGRYLMRQIYNALNNVH